MDVSELSRSGCCWLVVRLVTTHITGQLQPLTFHANREVANDIAEQKRVAGQSKLDIESQVWMDFDLNCQLADRLTQAMRSDIGKRSKAFQVYAAFNYLRHSRPLPNKRVIHGCD